MTSLAFRLLSYFRLVLWPNLWFGSTEIPKPYSHKHPLTQTNGEKDYNLPTSIPEVLLHTDPHLWAVQSVYFSAYSLILHLSAIQPLWYSKDKEHHVKITSAVHKQRTRLNLSSAHNKSVNKSQRVSTVAIPHKITDLNLLNHHPKWPEN